MTITNFGHDMVGFYTADCLIARRVKSDHVNEWLGRRELEVIWSNKPFWYFDFYSTIFHNDKLREFTFISRVFVLAMRAYKIEYLRQFLTYFYIKFFEKLRVVAIRWLL